MQAQLLSQNGFDITVQFTWDDLSTSTQTIHYVQDTSPGVTAAQSLANFLTAYATAYQAGLAKANAASLATLLNHSISVGS